MRIEHSRSYLVRFTNDGLLKSIFCIFLSIASFAHASTADGISAIRKGNCAAALQTMLPKAQKGDRKAQKTLGELYSSGDRSCPDFQTDGKKALEWYLLAAEAGDPEAQHHVASIYHDGLDVPQDRAKALKWLRKSAARGHARDLYRLSEFHERGDIVPIDRVLFYAFRGLSAKIKSRTDRDYQDEYLKHIEGNMSPNQLAEAKTLISKWRPGMALPETSKTGRLLPSYWFQKAADAGNVQALFRLGMIHRNNLEQNGDDKKALQYFRAAAEKGHKQAQEKLASMYQCGECGPVDLVLAYMLSVLSAQGKGSKEESAIEQMWGDILTEEQLAEARALITTWKVGMPLPHRSRTGHHRKVNYAETAHTPLTATPEIISLFKAANEGDEQTFNQLIERVQNINDYAIDGNMLLHALLLPPHSLVMSEDKWLKGHEGRMTAKHLAEQRSIYLSTLPAKTRMLALALQHNANASAGTKQLHASPLHLATVYGSPEMVSLLLKHGADPNQYGGSGYASQPLDFSLDPPERDLVLRELVTPEQRTKIILELLAAGAQMPYQQIDKKAVKETKRPVERPAADYLLWKDLASLTVGSEVLTAMEKTGTTPAFEEGNKSVLAFAAQAGNLDGLKWLLARVKGEHRQEMLTDAAIWSMYGDPEKADAILNLLVGEGLAWAQFGPAREDSFSRRRRLLNLSAAPQRDSTLLGHAVLTGRQDWVRKLINAGVPIDGEAGSRETPLALAVMEDDAGMVGLLLSLGAHPLAGDRQSPVMRALSPSTDSKNNTQIMTMLLKHVMQTKNAIPVEFLQNLVGDALQTSEKTGQASTMIKTLVENGFPANKFKPTVIAYAMQKKDRGLIDHLIAHGALKPETGKVMSKEYSYLFEVALFANREDLLPALLDAGIDPTVRVDKESMTPLEYAVANGHATALALFAKKHGMPQDLEQRQWGILLDLAVSSQNEDILKTVTNQYAIRLDHICLPDTDMLVDTIMKSSSKYWALLTQHGFGNDKDGCARMVDRIVRAIGDDPQLQLVGLNGRQLSQRLKDLSSNGSRLNSLISAETYELLVRLGRHDMVQVLQEAGWQMQRTNAAEPATK